MYRQRRSVIEISPAGTRHRTTSSSDARSRRSRRRRADHRLRSRDAQPARLAQRAVAVCAGFRRVGARAAGGGRHRFAHRVSRARAPKPRAHPTEEHFRRCSWPEARAAELPSISAQASTAARSRTTATSSIRRPAPRTDFGAMTPVDERSSNPASLRSLRAGAGENRSTPCTLGFARPRRRPRCRSSRAELSNAPTSATPGVYRISVICVSPWRPTPSSRPARDRRRAVRTHRQARRDRVENRGVEAPWRRGCRPSIARCRT